MERLTRFVQHYQRVSRVSDGRTGMVKDIEGVCVNVIWDDNRTREWLQVEDLTPRGD